MANLFQRAKKENRGKMTQLLAFIVAGTQSGAGHALVPLRNAQDMLKYEPDIIKIQNETPDAAGNVPVFATSKGVAAMQGGSQGEAQSQEGNTSGATLGDVVNAPKRTFELETGVPVPESKRGGGLKPSIYPFADMQVGQSFFVAATDAEPNPAKGLASTVSSANKRFAKVYPATTGFGDKKKAHPQAGQPTGKDGRTFTVRAVEEQGKGKGARVFRVS